jgi:signal transduction histidine kinase
MTPAAAIDYAVQPYLGTDVAAIVMAMAVPLYLLLWRRGGERGMGWFALGVGAIGLWIATNRYHVPVDRYVVASPLTNLLTLGFVGLALGLVDYLNLALPWRRRALWLTLLPVAVYGGLTLLVTLGVVNLLRTWANLMVALCFAPMAVLAWWAARREPGAGHGFIGAVLMVIPLLALGLAVAGADPVALRYWGVFPVLALTLLTVSMLRRRRALEAEVARRVAAEQSMAALNASLEARIAERTADLHHLVTGLESFNRNVSHDLRGTLAGIAGAAQLADSALRRGDRSQVQDMLSLIADQVDNSTRLVAALLSLAQVGDAALDRQAVDLQSLVRDVVSQLVAERHGEVLPLIEVLDLPNIDADPDLLRRVFVNLIGNAIKFSRDQVTPRIEVSATTSAGELTVAVRDNGVGFDTASATRLFSPFARLHGQKFDGHGVGLSIVRRAVERHGGCIWAESQPGQGAVFRFSLPLAP